MTQSFKLFQSGISGGSNIIGLVFGGVYNRVGPLFQTRRWLRAFVFLLYLFSLYFSRQMGCTVGTTIANFGDWEGFLSVPCQAGFGRDKSALKCGAISYIDSVIEHANGGAVVAGHSAFGYYK